MSVSCECWVLSGRGLCNEPIPRPEESFRERARARARVSLGVIRCNTKPLRLQRVVIKRSN